MRFLEVFFVDEFKNRGHENSINSRLFLARDVQVEVVLRTKMAALR